MSPERAEKESLLGEQAPGTGAGRQSFATPDLMTLRIAVSLGLSPAARSLVMSGRGPGAGWTRDKMTLLPTAWPGAGQEVLTPQH